MIHQFYLLLSFIDYFEKGAINNFTHKQIEQYQKIPSISSPISKLFHFLEMNSITLNANIIYSNMRETFVTRYASGKTKFCPLYLNNKNNGNDKSILITTKVLPGYRGVVIPEKSVLHIEHDKGRMNMMTI